MIFSQMTEKPIALITHEYPPKIGGAGSYCEELAYASAQFCVNVEVWGPRQSVDSEDFTVRKMPLKGSQSWICSWKFFRFLRLNHSKASILHLADPGALRAMLRFGWALKRLPPIFLTIHGSELLLFVQNPLEKLLFRSLLRRASLIHVLSKYNEDALKQLCPEISHRIRRTPGAPARKILPSQGKIDERTCENESTLTILCVGRIHPRKGQLQLIRAVHHLPGSIKKRLKLRLAGPIIKAKYYEELLSTAGKANLHNPIEFLGELSDEDLKNAYESADLFALTSMPQPRSVEGFGFVYLEAASHGLPVIAHDTGGVSDAVKDGETGLLVDSSNQSRLTEAIALLISDWKLRNSMSVNARKWAGEHSWQRVAESLYQNRTQ